MKSVGEFMAEFAALKVEFEALQNELAHTADLYKRKELIDQCRAIQQQQSQLVALLRSSNHERR